MRIAYYTLALLAVFPFAYLAVDLAINLYHTNSALFWRLAVALPLAVVVVAACRFYMAIRQHNKEFGKMQHRVEKHQERVRKRIEEAHERRGL